MKLLLLAELKISEERIRKSFIEFELEQLADNIQDKGLFHPVLLEKDNVTLIAGERRIRAIKLLHEGKRNFYHDGQLVPINKVPYVTIGDLTPIQILEVELEENEFRVNLSWKEKALAVEHLHKVRSLQAEARGEKHTINATAKEIDPLIIRSGDVSKDLIVAQYVGDDVIKKAKNRDEALKLIEKKLKRDYRCLLAENYDLAKLKSPHTLINGDLRDELPKQESEFYDLIIADPPYGIAAHKFHNQSAVEHIYDDTKSYADEIMEIIANEGYRITKNQAHAYIFCDIIRFNEIKIIFEKAGWYTWKWPLIWYKGSTIGLLPRPKHGPRRCYEAILFCIKGDKEIEAVGPDVLTIPHDKDIERGAHKPVDLYEVLMNRSCLPGNKVIDPCGGTGPVLSAASKVHLTATVIENDSAAFAQIIERIDVDIENVDVDKPVVDLL